MERPAEAFAVAVVRAWIEPEADGSLRVRIMSRTTGGEAERTIGVTSNIREAGRIIERWLREFVDTNDAGPATHAHGRTKASGE